MVWRIGVTGFRPTGAAFQEDDGQRRNVAVGELREQAYTKLTAAFGDNARIVGTERGGNAAANARTHIATYQTLGPDDEEPPPASMRRAAAWRRHWDD